MKVLLSIIMLAVCGTSAYALHIVGGGNGKKEVVSTKPSFSFSLNNTKPSTLGLTLGVRKPLRIKNNSNTSVGLEASTTRQIGVRPALLLTANTAYQFNITPRFSIAPIASFGLLNAPQQSEMANNYYKANHAYTSMGIQPSVQVFRGNGLKANVFMRYEFAHVSHAAMLNNLVPLTMMRLGVSLKAD
jgi:hypothetical protein